MLSRRAWLAGLIAAATVLFAIGVSVERSDSHHGEGAGVEHADVEHADASEGDEGEHAEGGGSSAPTEESGEGTPLVILAALVSLALALAAWMRPRSAPLLIVIALTMLAFAVVDAREIAHQIDESRAGLAAVAGIVAALHLAASGVALNMGRAVGPAG